MLVYRCDMCNEIPDCAQPSIEDRDTPSAPFGGTLYFRDWEEKDVPKDLARLSPHLHPMSRTRQMNPSPLAFPKHLQPYGSAERLN